MSQLYGRHWVDSYSDQVDPGKVWAAALRGVTRNMIDYGLKKLIYHGKPWPPTAPEFAALCHLQVDDFDVPSCEEAFRRVREWRNAKHFTLTPFEYTFYLELSKDLQSILLMKTEDRDSAAKKHYDRLMQKLLQGELLKNQPTMIAHEETDKPEPSVEAKNNFSDNLKEMSRKFKKY